jgi:two-component system, OmpR family, response regulator
MNGLDLCRNIRKISDVSIIISSVRTDIGDKLQAFDEGADDYLPKPYDPRELLA